MEGADVREQRYHNWAYNATQCTFSLSVLGQHLTPTIEVEKIPRNVKNNPIAELKYLDKLLCDQINNMEETLYKFQGKEGEVKQLDVLLARLLPMKVVSMVSPRIEELIQSGKVPRKVEKVVLRHEVCFLLMMWGGGLVGRWGGVNRVIEAVVFLCEGTYQLG